MATAPLAGSNNLTLLTQQLDTHQKLIDSLRDFSQREIPLPPHSEDTDVPDGAKNELHGCYRSLQQLSRALVKNYEDQFKALSTISLLLQKDIELPNSAGVLILNALEENFDPLTAEHAQLRKTWLDLADRITLLQQSRISPQ